MDNEDIALTYQTFEYTSCLQTLTDRINKQCSEHGFKSILKNSRRCSKEETEMFVEILADADNGFAQSLEKLALKKSSYNEVFEHIKRGMIMF